jgi:hypothetical protein
MHRSSIRPLVALLADGRMQCDLCPRDCRLHEGQRGPVSCASETATSMVLTTYGRSSGFCIDPVEKKPLNHFYPARSVLPSARRLQPRVQVLPELGHLQVARHGPAGGPGLAASHRARRRSHGCRASRSPTTIR